MSTIKSSPNTLERVTHNVAFLALLRSILISMVAPSLVYRFASPHWAPDSLIPLALSGVPPALSLAYSVFKQRAIDFLGLFAAEAVIVDMMALIASHSEKGALLGRALENPILAVFFFGSLVFGKPLVLYMSRQLSTGNDPKKRESFDAVATQEHAIRVYRIMTWFWIGALLVKAAGNVILAEAFSTKQYLIFNPIWSLATDGILVTWTMLYGRAKLVQRSSGGPTELGETYIPPGPLDTSGT
jgi:hypothetical protein